MFSPHPVPPFVPVLAPAVGFGAPVTCTDATAVSGRMRPLATAVGGEEHGPGRMGEGDDGLGIRADPDVLVPYGDPVGVDHLEREGMVVRRVDATGVGHGCHSCCGCSGPG